MSAFGTKRTSQLRRRMSAFGGIADVGVCLLYPQERTLNEYRAEHVVMSMTKKELSNPTLSGWYVARVARLAAHA
jgi:hypothetical protein